MPHQRGKIVSSIRKTFPSLSRILGMRDSSESEQDVVHNQLDSTADADLGHDDNALPEDSNHRVRVDNGQQIQACSTSRTQHEQDDQTTKTDHDVREPIIVQFYTPERLKSKPENENPNAITTSVELQSILRKHQSHVSMESLHEKYNENDYYIDFMSEEMRKSPLGGRFKNLEEAIAHLALEGRKPKREVQQVNEYLVKTSWPDTVGATQQSQGGRQTRSSGEAIGDINTVMLQHLRKNAAGRPKKKIPEINPPSPQSTQDDVTVLGRRSQKTQRTPPPKVREPESSQTSQSEGPSVEDQGPFFSVNRLITDGGGTTSESTSTSVASSEVGKTVAANKDPVDTESDGISDQEDTIANMLTTATKAKERRKLRKSLSRIQRTNEKGRRQNQTPLTSTAISRTQPELHRRRSDAFNHVTQIDEPTLNFEDDQDAHRDDPEVQVVKTRRHQHTDHRSPGKGPQVPEASNKEEQARKVQKVVETALIHPVPPTKSAKKDSTNDVLASKVTRLETQIARKSGTQEEVTDLQEQVRILSKELREREKYQQDLQDYQKQLQRQIDQQAEQTAQRDEVTQNGEPRQPMVTFNNDVQEHSARREASTPKSDMDISRPQSTLPPSFLGQTSATAGGQSYRTTNSGQYSRTQAQSVHNDGGSSQQRSGFHQSGIGQTFNDALPASEQMPMWQPMNMTTSRGETSQHGQITDNGDAQSLNRDSSRQPEKTVKVHARPAEKKRTTHKSRKGDPSDCSSSSSSEDGDRKSRKRHDGEKKKKTRKSSSEPSSSSSPSPRKSKRRSSPSSSRKSSRSDSDDTDKRKNQKKKQLSEKEAKQVEAAARAMIRSLPTFNPAEDSCKNFNGIFKCWADMMTTAPQKLILMQYRTQLRGAALRWADSQKPRDFMELSLEKAMKKLSKAFPTPNDDRRELELEALTYDKDRDPSDYWNEFQQRLSQIRRTMSEKEKVTYAKKSLEPDVEVWWGVSKEMPQTIDEVRDHFFKVVNLRNELRRQRKEPPLGQKVMRSRGIYNRQLDNRRLVNVYTNQSGSPEMSFEANNETAPTFME